MKSEEELAGMSANLRYYYRHKKTEEGYEIYVKRDNLVFPWKYTNMNVTVEYDILF